MQERVGGGFFFVSTSFAQDQSRAISALNFYLVSVISFFVPTHKLKEGLHLLWDNIFISYNVYGAPAMEQRE